MTDILSTSLAWYLLIGELWVIPWAWRLCDLVLEKFRPKSRMVLFGQCLGVAAICVVVWPVTMWIATTNIIKYVRSR